MSAIWGAVNLKGEAIAEETRILMRRAFDKCVIDRYEELYDRNVYMGCGIQYFTAQAHAEDLPYQKQSLYFTADVMLDDRERLLSEIQSTGDNAMPDGELLFRMLEKYQDRCQNELLGAFAYALYNREKNQLSLTIDAVGNRCLYYRVWQDTVYFSTLMEPLAQISEQTTLNDRWITDFLAMDHLFMINETEETPLHDIYRVAPAQQVIIDLQGIHRNNYWNPAEAVKERKLDSDEAYQREFLALWDKAVRDAMRTDAEVAIQLSGGLDSTAVTAVAAPYLKEKGKKLYSFTSIPREDYISDNTSYYIEDESEDVKKTVAYYGNIEPEFIDLDGKNAWEMADDELRIMEMPYKSVQNLLWLVDSMKKAYQKGARIILSGSYGNTTISFTDLNLYFNELYLQGKHTKLKKEIRKFAENMGFSRKYAWQKIKMDCSKPYESTPYIYGNSFVKREMADRVNSRERLDNLNKSVYWNSLNYGSYKKFLSLFWAFRQIGEITTKHSLASGVLLRDPTKDKRIVEFCMGLPLEQFCKEGIDRRLVKVYMKDMIPPHVIRFSKQGKQSADLAFRFQQGWEQISQEWGKLYEKYKNSTYVNTYYAKRKLTDIPADKMQNFDFTRHMYTLFVLRYEAYIKSQYPKGNVQLQVTEHEKKEEEPLLSVIIPIYNVVDYLEQCVKSVCGQTYRNLEILLIDDGSTDGSGALCDELARADSRIQVVHQSNGGLSAARNTGLQLAKGELIAFVDSDDWLDTTMYQDMYELLEEQQADIAICNYRKIKDNEVVDFSTNRIKVLYGQEVIDTYLTAHDCCAFSPAVWNRLYRHKYLKNMRFQRYKKYEDSAFNAELMPCIHKLVYIDRAYYNYRKRENSLTQTVYGEDDIQDFIATQRLQCDKLVSRLSHSRQCKKYMDYYCLLLDLYCGKQKQQADKAEKKLIQKELHRISKDAREGISNAEIPTKDKIQLIMSTYCLASYPFCNKLRKKAGRLRKKFKNK